MNCLICNRRLIQPTGPANARVLLVGDRPGYQEIESGMAFVGPTGQVLNHELLRLGWNREQVRVTNLWQHDPDIDERDAHRERLYKELVGRRAVFFMGTEVAKLFTGKPVTEVMGLPVYPASSRRRGLKSDLLPVDVEIAVFAVNPAIALQRTDQGVIGDFRDALEFFVKQAKEVLK